MPFFLFVLGFSVFGGIWLAFYPDEQVGDSWRMRFTFFVATLASVMGGMMCLGKLFSATSLVKSIFNDSFGPNPWWSYLPVVAVGIAAWWSYRRMSLVKQAPPGH